MICKVKSCIEEKDLFQCCQAPGPIPGPSQHSYSKERTWVDTVIKQNTNLPPPPTRQLLKAGNFEIRLSDNSEFQSKGPGLTL